jgi:hypothetical protein
LDFVKNEENPFDFNKVIPMPESLNVNSGPVTDTSLAAYDIINSKGLSWDWDIRKKNPIGEYHAFHKTRTGSTVTLEEYIKMEIAIGSADLKLGEKLCKNVELYGCPTWYEWCCRNWGTKWNAAEPTSELNGNTLKIVFDTAWSHPRPVIKKLASLFPDLRIDHNWADEDIGSNTGTSNYKYGIIEYTECPEDCSQRAYYLYEYCWERQACFGQDSTGKYYKKNCDDYENCGDCEINKKKV